MRTDVELYRVQFKKPKYMPPLSDKRASSIPYLKFSAELSVEKCLYVNTKVKTFTVSMHLKAYDSAWILMQYITNEGMLNALCTSMMSHVLRQVHSTWTLRKEPLKALETHTNTQPVVLKYLLAMLQFAVQMTKNIQAFMQAFLKGCMEPAYFI